MNKKYELQVTSLFKKDFKKIKTMHSLETGQDTVNAIFSLTGF